MRCFRKNKLPVFVPVQPVRPTFVVTKSGIVALSREHYNHLIALGDSHWGNFTRLYFEQRCEQLGVVVESDSNLNGTDAAENK